MILSFFTYRLLVIDIYGTELVITPFGLMFSLAMVVLLLSFIIFVLRTYIYCLRFNQVDHYPGPFERTQWHRQAFRRWTRLDEEEIDFVSDDEDSSGNNTDNLKMRVSISAGGLSTANVNIDLHEMVPGTPFSPAKIFFKGDFKETIV